MKKTLNTFFSLTVFAFACLNAQTERISPSTHYIGVAEASTVEAGRDKALQALVQQIQVFVSSSIDRTMNETDKEYSESLAARQSARSSMQLKDVGESVEKGMNGVYKVTKYISKKTVQALLTQRRKAILEHLEIAERELTSSAAEVNAEAVLKNYYWALLYSRMYMDTLSFSFTDPSDEKSRTSQNVPVTIAHIIESFLQTITFNPVKRIEDDNIVLDFDVRSKKKKITALSVNYYDGEAQSIAFVRAGIMTRLTFYFKDENLENRQVELEVDYRKEAEMSDELKIADSLQLGGTVPKRITISLSQTKQKAVESKVPPVLNELLTHRENVKEVMEVLRQLQKKEKIITGNDQRFESKEGLYRLVLSEKRIEGLLQFKAGSYIDAETGEAAEMKRYSGMRMTWIDVVK